MTDKISFANLQLKTGITPTTAPNALGLNDLGTTTGTAGRVLAAIVGDGDKTLETGETGFVVGGAGGSNAVANLATLDTAADPVTITLHGRMNASTVGTLAATALGYNPTWGFGIDNGPDGNNRLLNAGDALTFTTNAVGGVAQQVAAISFTVDRNGATTATELAFDFDGNVLKSGSYAAAANATNADTALRLANVAANAVVAIDFLGHHLTVNGAEQTSTDIDAFFAAYERSPKNVVTIGSITSNGFSVRDLVIDRAAYAGPAANAAPTMVTLTPVQTAIAETADISAAIKVADIVVADDGAGRNDLSLSGADAAMFQIVGNALYLKAGAALHAASKPALDVIVLVDDRQIGGTPDVSAAFELAVTKSAADRISFADVQLKSGVTPLTAPNALTSADLGTTTGVANRALVAITGNGDKAITNGETGYVLGGAASGNDVPNLATLDTAADPVTITMHGRTSTSAVGALAATALDFNNAWGFGIDNGPDANGRLLNAGDALTFTTNAVGGVAQQVTAISFIVDRNGATTSTEVAIDFDGDVLKTGSYAAAANAANADTALRLANVAAGATIAIDFAHHQLTVNGAAQTGADIDAFFAAYERSPKNVVTIGSITSNGFSVRDLVIDRATYSGPAANEAPSVSLHLLQTSISDTADVSAAIRVADIVVADDSAGHNELSLAGTDAGMFQIIGDGLYLKAGVTLQGASKPALDVTVLVDDAQVGATPDGQAAFALAVTKSAADHISFANLQLKTGATPATAPNGLTVSDLGTTTAAANRVLAAITGNGDKTLSNGETGYVVGGAGTSNAVTNLATLDTADDPVTITLHGRTSASAVGTLAATALGFTNAWGFGVDNGPDANNRLLNAGDALTFALNPVAGIAQQLTAISFAVDRNGATTATEVDLDFDGNVLKTGSYAANANAANANAALRLTGVPANAVITIDFAGHHLSINGTEQTGANIDAFFAAYEASPKNAVTIGSIATDGFSVRDLVIDRAEARLPVGPVADSDAATNTVAENAAAGTVVGVTAHAADPNAADTVSYSVSDGRFNVDANGVVTVAAGAAFDAETEQTITLHVTAKSTDGSSSAADFVVQVGDVNEYATGPVGDTDAAENTVATSAVNGTAVGITALAQDQDRTTNTITYGLEDASGAFGIDAATGKVTVADAGKLIAGSHAITVHATSADASSSTQTFTVNVTAANAHYGSIVLDGDLGEWAANTRLDTETAGAPGFIVRGTYEGGAFIVGIESTDGTVIGAGTTIWLNADLNTATGYQVWGSAVGAEFNINFDADGHARLYTGATPDQGGTLVANLDYGISADGHGVEVALPSSLAGGSHLADMVLDVNDSTFIPGNYWGPAFRIGENQPPSVSLAPVVTDLRENADVSHDIKVADIAVSDSDGLGSWTLSLTGANSGLFKIVNDASGPALYLKAGADLDYEKHQHLDVTVNVDDPSIGAPGVVENHEDFSLAIGDVNEAQGPITLDGALGEWASGSRLDAPSNGVAGYAVYGTYADDTSAFVIGLKTDGTAIGANTTIWLNTDGNPATGYSIWGNSTGADYKVEFGADGTPALYSLDAGGNAVLVAQNLDYFFSADRSTVELAVPSSLVGGSQHTGVYLDVNDQVFLSTDYANVQYHIDQKPALLPQDPTMRVAIVYSETSANAYFSKTAYDQLFMAAQYQAMQAGVPFDILTEDQLKDFNNLVSADGKVKYDAIVFPDFANVKSADLQAITDTLTTAVRDYHIGLIAAGNFMTNTETGAAFAGDAYARMKSLLGVTRVDGGATSGVVVHAGDGSHPVNHDFAAGSVVGNYTGSTAYDSFGDVTGSGQTLFTQTVAGAEKAAVIATTATGANSVHFATDAIFGNNNILQHAIDWAAHGDTPDVPDVGLELTRGSSLFFSRTDLDQSQEHFDVVDQNPGIYDALLPILQQWYQQYDFVGSYYANIGADVANGQQTDWTVSKPFYDALVAMENELGTHSYTHPEDTNYLLNDTFSDTERQAWLAHLSTDVPSQTVNALKAMTQQATQARLTQLLGQVDPATHANAIALVNALSATDREILKASYRFQFEYSKEILSQQLGISIGGAAVPGAPEQAMTSAAIMQYLDYISGGYSGVGAGYPGAFGFIDPDHQSKAYFAPNVPFDFSLVEFQHMSAADAAASWAATYQSIIASGETPIIHFPWHDYGPTDWDTSGENGAGHGPGYTTAMFTDFIARAYADGTEFVTGADLAQRILTFVHSDIEVTTAGSQVIAHVTGSGLGTFALDVDTDQTIASVDNWYAYDSKKVFLPTAGGTFAINLGNQAADVTHIAKLPMRAELLTVSGDGADLAYALSGRGDVVVDVKSAGGIIARGADAATLSGAALTLTHSAVGAHAGSVDWVNGAVALIGTDGDDFLFGSAAGTRIDGGRGTDALTGGGNADTFVFAPGDGNDTVRDFSLAEDRVELGNSAFASAAAALAAFADTTKGATIALSATDHLTLSSVTVAQLTTDHLILSSLV